MFFLSPSERKALVALAVLVFLGTLLRYFNLEVRDVKPFTASSKEQSLKININSASAFELQDLPGIGPVLSRRIVEYREQQGLFQEINDLKKVKGIGSHTAANIKKYIDF